MSNYEWLNFTIYLNVIFSLFKKLIFIYSKDRKFSVKKLRIIMDKHRTNKKLLESMNPSIMVTDSPFLLLDQSID